MSQVAEAFAPTVETINAVKEWLASFGIDEDRISIFKSSSWIRLNSTVGEVEKLLRTKYKVSILFVCNWMENIVLNNLGL
jgi:tripeptidyl-peptidase I